MSRRPRPCKNARRTVGLRVEQLEDRALPGSVLNLAEGLGAGLNYPPRW